MGKDSGKVRYTSPEGSAMWEYIAATSCSLLIFCAGFIPGWNSPTLSILMGTDSPIALSSSDASTLSSMLGLGQTVAPTLLMVMADKLGRKNSLLAVAIPMLISWGLIAFARDIIVLFVARFFGGVSTGLIFCLGPMYLGEIASPKVRGAIGMICPTTLGAGILFMFVLVPYLSVRATACICLSLVVIATISIWFIPESPYHLAMAGKIDEAEGTLEKLRGKADVTEELNLIMRTISQDCTDPEICEVENEPQSSAFNLLFTVPGNRKALFISIMFLLVLQFGSYISIMSYSQLIFERMKSNIPGHVCTMIIAVLQLVCNILTTFVIDTLGRKTLICISGLVSGTCLLVDAVYLYLLEYTAIDVSPYAVIAVYAAFINVVALSIGLVPVQMITQSEIFGTRVKGLTSCIIGVCGGIMAVVGVKFYLMLAETWNYGHSVPFFIFVAVTWTDTAIIMKLLPETKGKTFLEIQRDLNA